MTASINWTVNYSRADASDSSLRWGKIVGSLATVLALSLVLLLMDRGPSPLVSQGELSGVHIIRITRFDAPLAVLRAEHNQTPSGWFLEGTLLAIEPKLIDALMSQLTEPLPSVQPTTISLDRAGLSPPRLILELGSSSATHRYEFGMKHRTLGSVYVRRSDSQVVYLVPSQLVATIESLYEETLGRASSEDRPPDIQAIEMS